MYTTIMEGRVGIALACTVSRNISVASVVDTVRACAHRVVEVLQKRYHNKKTDAALSKHVWVACISCPNMSFETFDVEG